MTFGFKSSRSSPKTKRTFGKSEKPRLANFLGAFDVFKKKENVDNIKPANSGSRVYYSSHRSNENTQKSQYKVFKPSNLSSSTENLKTETVKIDQKKFFFNWKPLESLKRNSNISSIKSTIRNLKLEIMKLRILDRFNQVMVILLICSSVGFVMYLSFFDTHFLVKTYSVQFDEGSFLDQSEVDKIMQNIRNQKQLSIFPNNQYWFLNEESLTKIGKETVPEVEKISLLGKSWPSSAELKIETKPILLTLATTENNQKKYWRIGQAGQVVSEDSLALRENLVSVDRNISFDKPGVSLKNYAIEENQEQVNRFWFVVWLWKQLGDLKIPITTTSLPSIMDTDVEIQTMQGTRLLFSSNSFTPENQKKRIDSIFAAPTVADREKQRKLVYIDFRIPKKIFICERGKVCEK